MDEKSLAKAQAQLNQLRTSAMGTRFYKEPVTRQVKYDEMKSRFLTATNGDKKLINIIENESDDYDRRMAFMGTTYEEILRGADYSQCETIEQMSEVYAHGMLKRLGFLN